MVRKRKNYLIQCNASFNRLFFLKIFYIIKKKYKYLNG
jgi:hypothetical protein